MRLCTVNVKGALAQNKVLDLLSFMKDRKMEMALLTESHLNESTVAHLKQRYPQYGWF